jgi:phosphatidylserine/phosphatidylglycerophosphate/cardiolipin synthase-like enzyme
VEALFSSLVGGDGLRRRLLELVAEATALADTRAVDVHVMTFAFTDEEVADALVQAATRQPSMTIRILADWGQRSRGGGQQVAKLARLGLPNLRIRYKTDQPYAWNATKGGMRWSYHASHGLLHHKILSVIVDRRPWKLICGSFNWTTNAARSYENLLVVSTEQPWAHELMSRIELEFEAMWSDGRVTLSPEEAHLHYQAIRQAFQRDPTLSPAAVVGLARGAGEPLQRLAPDCQSLEQEPVGLAEHRTLPSAKAPQVLIAFSSQPLHADDDRRGYAEPNRSQRFLLYKPSTRTKRVPLTLTTLALDTIFRAAPGDTLKVAMYGLSTRVPEYGALLDAARRGVRVFVLLDTAIGTNVLRCLVLARELEGLPIEVRSCRKMMHQKYIVHADSNTVLTGTANMTTDASTRHSEHRLVVRGCSALVEQFSADFDAIWSRLSG